MPYTADAQGFLAACGGAGLAPLAQAISVVLREKGRCVAALDGMASALQKEYGGLPMLFAGGVMSNRLIREALTEKYGAVFAEPAFSSDNAAGIAVLTEMKRCGAC